MGGFLSKLGGLVTGNLPGIGQGLAGLFPKTTSTTTDSSGSSNSTVDSNSNYNNFANTNLLTSLLTLLNTATEQNSTGTSTTTPNLSPETQGLISKLTGSYSALAKPFDTAGYVAGQSQDINRRSDLASQSANNIMASRGLSTSPAAATTAMGIDTNRLNQLQSLSNSAPMIGNQMNLANLGAAAGFMNMIPHGTTTTTAGSQTGTSSQSGSQQGSQTGSQSSGGTAYQQQLGSNNSQQHQEQKTKAGGGLGGLLSGLFGGG